MNCQIRHWKLSDANALVSIMNNKKIQDNLRDGLSFPYSYIDAVEFIYDMQEEELAFAITMNGRVIGSIGAFRNQNIHYRTAEIGYYIDEALWGKGLGTSAVKELCAFVFENTDIVRLFAEPFADNFASCKVLEKAGFVLEGILRKNAEKNGRIIDMKMYALVLDS